MVDIQPKGSKPPLFYVAPFLISVLSLHDLAACLGENRPFFAFQPQGIEGDDPIHESIEEMAAHYIREMKSVQPSGPYNIGGHCSGGWVAFEMARQLRRADEDLSVLIVVDAEPPGIDRPRIRLGSWLLSRVRLYGRSGRMLSAVRWRMGVAIQRLSVRQPRNRRRDRTTAMLAAHFDAFDRYRGGPVDTDLVLVRSEEWAQLADKEWHLGWSTLVDGIAEIEIVPGSHAELLAGQNAPKFATALRVAIEDS
jgi:aspartate racemase